MRRKRTFCFLGILLFIIVTKISAQNVVAEISNQDNKYNEIPLLVFIVENDENNDKAVFQVYRNFYYSVLYDTNWEKKGSVFAYDLPNRFNAIIGCTIENNTYHLIFNTSNGRSYGITSFNFTKESATSFQSDFKLQQQKFLGTTQINNVCHLYSADQNDPKINVFAFSANNLNAPESSEIPIKNLNLSKLDNNKKVPFKELFKGEIVSIAPSLPVSIEEAGHPIKVYNTENGKVSITSTALKDFSYIIEVDLIKKEANAQRFENQFVSKKSMTKKATCFLFEDQLWQFQVSTEGYLISTRNIKTREKLYELKQLKDLPITSINTPIIQIKGSLDNTRELETTKQFVRKMSQSNVGISVYRNKDVIEVTYGSYIETETGPIFIPIVAGSFIEGFMLGALSSFASYSTTKSVQVTSIFNANLEQLQGEVPKNIFDTIDEFSKKEPSVLCVTLKEIDDKMIWGNYDKKVDVYYLYEFKK